MTKVVHLLCGVPGSGKTRIATQFRDKFAYVPHDEYPVPEYKNAIISAAKKSTKPVLAECPFRMSILKDELKQAGLTVFWYFIREPEEMIAMWYAQREGEVIPRRHLSNYRRYLADSRDWIVGSQKLIIALLKSV